MSITATELKTNLSKYLLMASKEDVYITQYGKIVAISQTLFKTGLKSQSRCLAFFLRP